MATFMANMPIFYGKLTAFYVNIDPKGQYNQYIKSLKVKV